jgi:pimeloyl-ACP methyl ester carboxylesterase
VWDPLETALGLVPGGGGTVAVILGGAARGTPVLGERGSVEVTAAHPVPVPPPAGVADLLARVAASYPDAGAAAGTVRVLRVVGADGKRAWVVAIPGTQDWSPVPGSDPFDATADVASMAGAIPAAGVEVVRALELAGAGPGEPVLLAGHSLGGMLAAQLAADARIRRRFDIRCVLTAGSPIARYAVPDDVAVLSLEHADDLVPALDGLENPDRASWVTVYAPSGPLPVPATPAAAHDVRRYVATGARVDASTDPSLVAWRAVLRPFLAGAGVTATETVVVGRRRSASTRDAAREVPRQVLPEARSAR